jgi:alginate O-acetyltransferase complex protein AlgI
MSSNNIMLFTEPRFLFCFLPVVLLAYYLSPRAVKNSILLVASVLFYGFGEGYYTGVIVFSIVFNFIYGHVIDHYEDKTWRRSALAFAIAVNIAVLVFFKYAGFVVQNVNVVLHLAHLHAIRPPRIHLPIGISFFTFHALSYVVDVYRREVKPMRRFASFALYITLFPQLIAGPIIRYKTICDQFSIGGEKGRRHTWEGFSEGVRRLVIGFGKKVLIADIAARAADGIFGAPVASITPQAAWLGVLCYTLEIYFDFAGYSDMAIGLGRMFGFKFPENFNYPYIAASVTDFWRRWHMSLSLWFRDYLYIPLGGNRVSPARTYFNLATVFLLCGLWHGATWNFIIWGLYYGVFLIVERVGFGKWLERQTGAGGLLRHVYLLLVVGLGWVWFRSPSLHDALRYMARLAFVPSGARGPTIPAELYLKPELLLALGAGVIGSVPWLPRLQGAWRRWCTVNPGIPAAMTTLAGRIAELACLAVIFQTSAAFSATSTYSPFIYFRF